MFMGNKSGLAELMVILLDNAIKYSPAKSTITYTVTHPDSAIVFSVEDHGMGIDAKDIPHIFDRFYRADKSRSKQDVAGYGLGLSIAKKIVDYHRGTISVISKVGEGTRFVVRIPQIAAKH